METRMEENSINSKMCSGFVSFDLDYYCDEDEFRKEIESLVVEKAKQLFPGKEVTAEMAPHVLLLEVEGVHNASFSVLCLILDIPTPEHGWIFLTRTLSESGIEYRIEADFETGKLLQEKYKVMS